MRILALIEVVIACCLCFLAYRALQQTPLGTFEREIARSYLPGCTMLVLAFITVLMHRNSLRFFRPMLWVSARKDRQHFARSNRSWTCRRDDGGFQSR